MAQILAPGIVSIKADVKEALDFFENLNVSEKTITKSILRAVGQGGKKAMRQGYNAVLRKRTGTLYKSLKYYLYRNGKTLVFTNTADSGKRTSKDGRTARYGFMLASGYDIQPKAANKYLTFQINGKWVKSKHVHVSARDFAEGPVERFINSSDCDSKIDAALQKQIDRIEKKLGVANA